MLEVGGGSSGRYGDGSGRQWNCEVGIGTDSANEISTTKYCCDWSWSFSSKGG